MIDLEKRHLDEVLAILKRQVPDCEVRAFGSRVTGKARQFSDLDLALVGKGEIGWQRVEALKDAFSESDIPITVDVLDWHAISEDFRRHIAQKYEILQLPQGNKAAI